MPGTSFADGLLEPGQAYHYIVRAFDSRSGEDTNLLRQTVVAPDTADLTAPIFAGLASAEVGAGLNALACHRFARHAEAVEIEERAGTDVVDDRQAMFVA